MRDDPDSDTGALHGEVGDTRSITAASRPVGVSRLSPTDAPPPTVRATDSVVKSLTAVEAWVWLGVHSGGAALAWVTANAPAAIAAAPTRALHRICTPPPGTGRPPP
ncbi:MAG: hypothetical protein U0Y82_05280 [Thermoleophilia bacterium]